MANVLNKNFIWLIALLIVFISSEALADVTKYNPDEGYQGNSFQEYEEFQSTGSGYSDCFSSGKVFSDNSALQNTQIPKNIGRGIADTDANSTGNTQTALNVSRAVGYSLVGIASFGIGLIIAAIDYSIMVDVCSNAYVLTAAEQVTLQAFPEPDVPDANICYSDKPGVIDPTKLGGNNRKAYSSNEIPYLFHCDPRWDPTEGNGGGQTNDPLKIGRTYGYAGGTSPSCNLGLNAAQLTQIRDSMGKIVVGYWPKISRGWYSAWGGDAVCRPAKHSFDMLEAGQEEYIGTIHFYAFYWQQPRTGKIRLCAVAPYTMFPVLAGCGTVAPPVDILNTDEFIQTYVRGTRCAYLLKARDDLVGLGNRNLGGENSSVNKFLRSDLHLTSTVVGCVKDMLLQIFVTSAANPSGPDPFFQVVQERMRIMVIGALTLYVSLLGIKIMTAGQPPSRAEAVMYVLKFALVFWFAVGDAWYNPSYNLFPSMLNVSEQLSSIFLEAQNVNDPISACFFNFNGSNILGNRDIPALGGAATEGYNGIVKTTVWDLVDCKVVNYLSFGSCNYTTSGMMSSWLFAGLLRVDFSLAICCMIYSIMVMITVFRFAHIFILSIFTISILVFLSPIFLCFALFEPTKGMFQKWMQMLLGYMIYPALLFAFVAIMFATFDSVFYGDLKIRNNSGDSVNTYLSEACADVNSIFCKNMEKISYVDPCTSSPALLGANLIESERIPAFGSAKKVDAAYAGQIRDPVMKLLLFAFLFYLFLGSVTEFMAVLVGVQGLGDVSKGLGAGLKPISFGAGILGKLAAKKVAGGAASAVGKAVGSAKGTKR